MSIISPIKSNFLTELHKEKMIALTLGISAFHRAESSCHWLYILLPFPGSTRDKLRLFFFSQSLFICPAFYKVKPQCTVGKVRSNVCYSVWS